MKQKPEIPSTSQPLPIPEDHPAAHDPLPDDYEMTIKEPAAGAGYVPAHPDELRQTMAVPPAAVRETMLEGPAPVAAGRSALPYRSYNRPPTGLLIALDDGRPDSGEEWRIRGERFIIGRTAGDAIIPHDVDISGEHAEIGCRERDGGYEWHLRDLKSTNGTFLRTGRVILRNGKEILLGGRRYVFRHPGVVTDAAASGESPVEAGPRVTQPFGRLPSDVARQLAPRLVELTPAGEGREFLLADETSSIGSDPAACRLVVKGDPFIDGRHARLLRDQRGRWVIEDLQSLNGLWVRVDRVPLDSASEFQLGGQRFRFRIL